MALSFILWDVTSGDLVGTYPSEPAALSLVRRSLRAFGPAGVLSLSLVREDPDGALYPIAEADSLVEYARATA